MVRRGRRTRRWARRSVGRDVDLLAGRAAQAASTALRRAAVAEDLAHGVSEQLSRVRDELSGVRDELAAGQVEAKRMQAELAALREELLWAFAERRVAGERTGSVVDLRAAGGSR